MVVVAVVLRRVELPADDVAVVERKQAVGGLARPKPDLVGLQAGVEVGVLAQVVAQFHHRYGTARGVLQSVGGISSGGPRVVESGRQWAISVQQSMKRRSTWRRGV